MPFSEPLDASEHIRAAQAEELRAYLNDMPAGVPSLGTVRKPDLRSVESYVRSQAPMREALLRWYGYPPPGDPSGEPARFDEIGRDDLATYFRFSISVLPAVHSVGLFVVPRTAATPAPLVVFMHGALGSPEKVIFDPSSEYKDAGRAFLEHGYVLWAPTHLYLVDGQAARDEMQNAFTGTATTLHAVELLKVRRALDSVIERPEVDAARVAMIGGSYGGFYTRLAGATDPRIRVAGIWAATSDMRVPWAPYPEVDVDALICPKPLLQVHGTSDWIPIDGAREAAKRTTALYERLGIADRYQFVEFDGGHEFYADERVWEFLRRGLS